MRQIRARTRQLIQNKNALSPNHMEHIWGIYQNYFRITYTVEPYLKGSSLLGDYSRVTAALGC